MVKKIEVTYAINRSKFKLLLETEVNTIEIHFAAKYGANFCDLAFS